MKLMDFADAIKATADHKIVNYFLELFAVYAFWCGHLASMIDINTTAFRLSMLFLVDCEWVCMCMSVQFQNFLFTFGLVFFLYCWRILRFRICERVMCVYISCCCCSFFLLSMVIFWQGDVTKFPVGIELLFLYCFLVQSHRLISSNTSGCVWIFLKKIWIFWLCCIPTHGWTKKPKI